MCVVWQYHEHNMDTLVSWLTWDFWVTSWEEMETKAQKCLQQLSVWPDSPISSAHWSNGRPQHEGVPQPQVQARVCMAGKEQRRCMQQGTAGQGDFQDPSGPVAMWLGSASRLSLSTETPGLSVLRKSVVCVTLFGKHGRKSTGHYRRCPGFLLGWGW